jgi:hypothetical protein
MAIEVARQAYSFIDEDVLSVRLVAGSPYYQDDSHRYRWVWEIVVRAPVEVPCVRFWQSPLESPSASPSESPSETPGALATYADARMCSADASVFIVDYMTGEPIVMLVTSYP